MLVIAFEPNTLVGGYGDRVVGLIAVYLMAKLLKRPFKILWTKEDISSCISLGDLAYTGPPIQTRIDSIDSLDKLRTLLRNAPNPFPKNPTLLTVNQEISHHLYANPKFTHESFLLDIQSAYQELYTTLLPPTHSLKARAAVFAPRGGEPQIGIQIRCGDVYMKTTFRTSHCVLPDAANSVPQILANIKRHVEQTFASYTVFVTSDWRGAIGAAKELFGEENVCGLDEDVQHLDRPKVASLEKVFLDNYILATQCSRLYISLASNYGRIAALASPPTTQIFDLNALPVIRSMLVSKETLDLS